jgi:hypothetical protein
VSAAARSTSTRMAGWFIQAVSGEVVIESAPG